jgi:signal peptidase
MVTYIVMLAFRPDQMMDYLGFRSFIITSDSMEPVLEVNDLIVIKQVDEEDIQKNDIITFYTYLSEIGQYGYVTHNVVDIIEQEGETVYITQGERHYSDSVDRWFDENGDPINITIEEVEGEYVFKIPKVGYIKALIIDPIFLGVILINGFVIYITVRFIRKTKQK